MRVLSLLMLVITLGFLIPEKASADKMHPGMMSHKKRFGLNANTLAADHGSISARAAISRSKCEYRGTECVRLA